MINTISVFLFLGAAVVGLVSVAGVYLIDRYHENKKHKVTARIDDELTRLREDFKLLQNERSNRAVSTKPTKRRLKTSSNVSVTSTEDYPSTLDADSSEEYYDLRSNRAVSTKPTKRRLKASSNVSVTSTEDYTSALVATSSEEYYYLSSDEDVTISENSVNLLDREIRIVDNFLQEENYNLALGKLKVLNKEHPQNPEILWRLGKALKIKITFTSDAETRKQLLLEGISICEKAVNLKPESAHCHKWLAILYGLRGDLQPIKERILDGCLYSKHIEKALEITPDDAELHHLLGRFTFEVAKLTWLEKTIAGTLFSELPNCTYEDALQQFMEAERRISYQWKENRLFIAKCELAIGKTEKAVEWLNKAESVRNDEDEKVHEEVKMLLEKYQKL